VSEQYKRHPNTKCTVCRKEIYKRPSVIQVNSGRVFCSITCYGIANRKEVSCIVCGKRMLSGLNKKTCSRACANQNRIGTKYHQNRPRDKVITIRRIKIRLFEARGEECERCGYKRAAILQVHHKDRNHSNNELNNLEILCPNCHYEEHLHEDSQVKAE